MRHFYRLVRIFCTFKYSFTSEMTKIVTVFFCQICTKISYQRKVLTTWPHCPSIAWWAQWFVSCCLFVCFSAPNVCVVLKGTQNTPTKFWDSILHRYFGWTRRVTISVSLYVQQNCELLKYPLAPNINIDKISNHLCQFGTKLGAVANDMPFLVYKLS